MKEVIWIFGQGASGKKTMMLEAANHQIRPSRIRYAFGLGYTVPVLPLILCTRTTEDRKDLILQAINLDIDAVILIHGQDVDWKKGILKSLYNPKLFNRCGYVFPDEGEYIRRRLCRGKEGNNYERARKRKELVLNYIRPYFNQIENII